MIVSLTLALLLSILLQCEGVLGVGNDENNNFELSDDDDEDTFKVFVYQDRQLMLFHVPLHASVERFQQYISSEFAIAVSDQMIFTEAPNPSNRRLSADECIPIGQPTNQPSK